MISSRMFWFTQVRFTLLLYLVVHMTKTSSFSTIVLEACVFLKNIALRYLYVDIGTGTQEIGLDKSIRLYPPTPIPNCKEISTNSIIELRIDVSFRKSLRRIAFSFTDIRHHKLGSRVTRWVRAMHKNSLI